MGLEKGEGTGKRVGGEVEGKEMVTESGRRGGGEGRVLYREQEREKAYDLVQELQCVCLKCVSLSQSSSE